MSLSGLCRSALCHIWGYVVQHNVAFGLMSFGYVSFGALSLGLMSLGLMSFGLMSFGLLSVYHINECIVLKKRNVKATFYAFKIISYNVSTVLLVEPWLP